MVRFIKNRIALLVFLAGFSVGNAQNIIVSAKIDSSKILIGDQVKVKFQVDAPDKITLFWPALNDSLTEHIEIISRSKIDTVKNTKKGWQSYFQTITITCFDSGAFYFPQVPFIYKKQGDTTTVTLLSDSLLLSVNTVQVDTTKAIKDIKPPLSAPYTFEEILPYILIAFGVVAIALFLIYYFKKRKKGEPIFEKAKPQLPPHIIALEALEQLKTKKLWQNNKVKDYYTELTEIIRVYLENRFHINALEMTSDEIIESFVAIEINSELKLKLASMLTIADLVKFAKASPLPNEHDQSYDTAVNFVEQTKQETLSTNEKDLINK